MQCPMSEMRNEEKMVKENSNDDYDGLTYKFKATAVARSYLSLPMTAAAAASLYSLLTAAAILSLLFFDSTLF